MNLPLFKIVTLIYISFYIIALSASCTSIAAKYSVLKTPEERFESLEDYQFKTNFIKISEQLSMHYVDEGSKSLPVVLLLHGEPSWSYTYRNIIPSLTKSGYRVIAPDLIGFGKSDKPIKTSVHTYNNHTQWLKSFISKLNLKNINLFAHDWGGMIAFRVIAQEPEWFSKIIISNAFLFTGEESFPDSFIQWQQYSQNTESFDAGTIMDWGSYTKLGNSIKYAYSAPFPSENYKAAIRHFPSLIPANKKDPDAIVNRQLREQLKKFNKPFLTIWSSHEDKMWLGKEAILQTEIAGAKGQHHQILKSSHFIQEDQAPKLVEIMLNFYINSPENLSYHE